MVFEVTASDASGSTATFTVNAEVRGYAGPGQPVALLEPGAEMLAGNIGVPAAIGGGLNGSLRQAIASVPQFPGSSNNPRKFIFFGGSTGRGFSSYRLMDEVSSDESFSKSTFFEVGTLTFNLRANAGSGTNFVLLDEMADLFRYFIQQGSSAPFDVIEAESFAVRNPCYVAERTSTAQDFIWVGQKDDGLSLIRLLPLGGGRFNTEVLDTIGIGRSICHILPTKFSNRILPSSNDDSGLSDIIAVDYNANELVLYGDRGEDDSYDELEVVPLDTQTTADLEIVDVFSRGSESLEPRYLVILLADDRDGGDHRLVLVAQDSVTREISQTTYPLGSGVPIAMIDGPYIGERPLDQFERDIVVLTENSGSDILEYLRGPNTSTPPTFGAPQRFDTGKGVGSAVVSNRSDDLDSTFEPVLLIVYPETGIVRQFRPAIEISD